MQFHLDSQPGRNKLKPDQSGDPVPNETPHRQVDVYGSQTVPDFLVHANMDGGGNPVPKPAPSELPEHSTSVEHSLRPEYPLPDDIPGRRVCVYDSQTVSDLLVDSRADGGGNPGRWASGNQPVSELRRSDNQTIRQLASVRDQCQKLAPSEIVEQPRSRGRLWPETESLGCHPLLC